jgi:hypothetical protein
VEETAEVTRSEHTEQTLLVARVRHFYPWAIIAAVPNGGFRRKAEAVRLKAEGVLPGFPDLILQEPRGGCHGAVVEMKKTTGGRVSEKQADIHAKLRVRGYHVIVAHGVEEAWRQVEEYLKLPPTRVRRHPST